MPIENGAKVANEWQPMSAEMCVGPEFALSKLQRGEHRTLGTAGAEVRRARRQVADRRDRRTLVAEQSVGLGGHLRRVDAGGLGGGQEIRQPAQHDLAGVFAGFRQRALAVDAGLDVGTAQLGVDRLLDVIRESLFDDQHVFLADAERLQFVGDQRIDEIEAVDRDAGIAEIVGEAEARQRAQQRVGQPAERDDTELLQVAVEELIQFVLARERLRGRQPLVDLELLLHKRQRRMREARIIKDRRAVDAVEAGLGRGAIGLGGELAGDVAGAHAQLEHHWRVARLGELESLLDHAHDGRQVRARVEQPHRGFHRIGIRTLLNDARALAVVLAEDDHRAADHAGRRQVRQRIGRHVGADDRLPGDGAA